jgi:carbon storage regulator
MLILSRKTDESIVIDGRVIVKVVRVEGDVVKLGIDAPEHVPVHRQEVYDEIQRTNKEALTYGRPKPFPRTRDSKDRNRRLMKRINAARMESAAHPAAAR